MLTLMKTTLSFIWLVMAISVGAQTPPPSDDFSDTRPVLDIHEQALQRGVEYYMQGDDPSNNPTVLTMISRNNNLCPSYSNQLTRAVGGPEGIPVILTAVDDKETLIWERRDFLIAFSPPNNNNNTCNESPTWKIGQKETSAMEATPRTMIVTGGDANYTSVFQMNKESGGYVLKWCPTNVCPTCANECGSVGTFLDDEKNLLLALNGTVNSIDLPVSFKRKR